MVIVSQAKGSEMAVSQDHHIAKMGRHISVVIVASILFWLLVQLVGRELGWPGRYAMLADFAALAALVYAGVNIVKLLRMRREDKG